LPNKEKIGDGIALFVKSHKYLYALYNCHVTDDEGKGGKNPPSWQASNSDVSPIMGKKMLQGKRRNTTKAMINDNTRQHTNASTSNKRERVPDVSIDALCPKVRNIHYISCKGWDWPYIQIRHQIFMKTSKFSCAVQSHLGIGQFLSLYINKLYINKNPSPVRVCSIHIFKKTETRLVFVLTSSSSSSSGPPLTRQTRHYKIRQ
jgi:hypothetical protein